MEPEEREQVKDIVMVAVQTSMNTVLDPFYKRIGDMEKSVDKRVKDVEEGQIKIRATLYDEDGENGVVRTVKSQGKEIRKLQDWRNYLAGTWAATAAAFGIYLKIK